MREYKMAILNKGLSFSREKDIEKAEIVLNEYIAEGWILQQIVSPADEIGTLVAVFYREKL